MLNELKEKIIELVPEIVELKFGCEVWCSFEGLQTRGFVTDIPDSFGQVRIQIPGYYSVIKEVDTLQILGRPITLEDVLKAADIKSPSKDVEDLYYREIMENLVFKGYWLLGKSLDEQPERNIAFLHSVICK